MVSILGAFIPVSVGFFLWFWPTESLKPDDEYTKYYDEYRNIRYSYLTFAVIIFFYALIKLFTLNFWQENMATLAGNWQTKKSQEDIKQE